MVSWQVIFLPHLLVVVAWLVLCHLQIGPTDQDKNAQASDSAVHTVTDEAKRAA